MVKILILIFAILTSVACKSHREGYQKAITKCKAINTPLTNKDEKLYFSIEFNRPYFNYKHHIYDEIKKFLSVKYRISEFIIDDNVNNELLIWENSVRNGSSLNGNRISIHYQVKCIIRDEYLKVEISDLYIIGNGPDIKDKLSQEKNIDKITLESAVQNKKMDCEVIQVFDNCVEIIFNQFKFRFGS